jgi:hypothetical protein
MELNTQEQTGTFEAAMKKSLNRALLLDKQNLV